MNKLQIELQNYIQTDNECVKLEEKFLKNGLGHDRHKVRHVSLDFKLSNDLLFQYLFLVSYLAACSVEWGIWQNGGRVVTQIAACASFSDNTPLPHPHSHDNHPARSKYCLIEIFVSRISPPPLIHAPFTIILSDNLKHITTKLPGHLNI